MDVMEEIKEAINNVVTEDAESIISNENNNALQYSQTYNVHVPKADDKIMLDASAARKIRHACEEAQRKSVPYAEIFLALASLFIGGTLSALISQVAYELKFQSVLFYTICPVAGVGFAVAYWFYRKKENIDIFQLAEKVEEYIINPDEAESEE